MGIPGLFSFMDNNEHFCYEKYSLKNVPLVVDGCSIAAYIACQCGNSATFGGDYDKIGHITARFFNMFRKCGVIPIVIFDGASETKKLKTTISRMKNRVISLEKVVPGQHCSLFFPIMLRITIKAKLQEMGITVLQTDFEADREIAAVAKCLNDAPVLTNDSDFFIFDVPFIPLNSMEFRINTKGMPCKIYRQSKLVNGFRLKDPKALLLLPVIRGNDYINSFYFINFLENIPKYRNSNKSVSQKSIKSFLLYLQNETYDSALAKMMASVPAGKRKAMKKIIKKIVLGYTDMSTILVDYISPETLNQIKSLNNNLKALNDKFGYLTLSDDEDGCDDEEVILDEEIEEEDDVEEEEETEDEVELSELEEEEEEEDNEDIIESTKVQTIEAMPNWFLDLSRTGKIDQDILTLMNVKLFFNDAQVENYSLSCAGDIAIPFIKLIAGIALGQRDFSFWSRKGHTYNSKVMSTSQGTLHEKVFVEIASVHFMKNHRKIMLNFFNVSSNFLAKFPEEWKLYLLAIIYWVKNSKNAKLCHVHALILTMVVSSMEKSIGDFKSFLFFKIKGDKIKKLEASKKRVNISGKNVCPIKTAQKSIKYCECLLMAESIYKYFKLDPMVRKSKITSKKSTVPIVHTFSEFQAILKATLMLNDILRQCFKPTDVTKLFNGTFLYNMAASLNYKKNITRYIVDLFAHNGSPSLATLYLSLYEALKEFAPQIICEVIPKQKN